MSIDKERYARNLMLEDFDLSQQEKLQESCVGIIGAGALGSVVAMYLAAAGVGILRIADFDTIALSNLQRQVFFSERGIGESKCHTLAERVSNLNSHTKVKCVCEAITNDNIDEFAEGCDVIAECTDKISSKIAVVESLQRLRIPVVVGGVREYQGQVSVFTEASTLSYGDLFPVDPDITLPPPGVFSPVPGIVGSLQAAEVLKLLTGIGEPLCDTLLHFDVRTMDFHKFSFRR